MICLQFRDFCNVNNCIKICGTNLEINCGRIMITRIKSGLEVIRSKQREISIIYQKLFYTIPSLIFIGRLLPIIYCEH